MNRYEYRQLQAEKGALEKLLAQLPVDSVIERMGLEARKQEITEALGAQPAPQREPVRARLTFRGKPIVADYGIFAEFGAVAVNAFAEAVAAIGASQSGPLGTRGILPGREEFRLLITGTAPGSFGFQFEEAQTDDLTLFDEQSPLELAINQAQAIMQASLGTDDELTEAASEVDPRALAAISKFLETMATNEAVCALEFRNEMFRFADVEQVRRSANRLGRDNLHEEEKTLIGQFLGVLPNRRTFELLVDATHDVVAGKVGKAIEDASSINRVLNKTVKARVNSRRVGEGRPRYVLLGYEESGQSSEEDEGLGSNDE